MTRWFNSEDESLVSESVVEDALYSKELRAAWRGWMADLEGDDDEGTNLPDALPSEFDMTVYLRRLEKWGFDSNYAHV